MTWFAKISCLRRCVAHSFCRNISQTRHTFEFKRNTITMILQRPTFQRSVKRTVDFLSEEAQSTNGMFESTKVVVRIDLATVRSFCAGYIK